MENVKFSQIKDIITCNNYSRLLDFKKKDINTVLNISFSKTPEYEKVRNFLDNQLKFIRNNQKSFRDVIINRFDGHCAVRPHLDESICEAAHLYPSHKCGERDKYNEYNGVLLNKNLHKAFDLGYFTIDEKTCCIKLKIDEDKCRMYDMEGIDGVYINQLDNPQSKKYLFMLNNNFN
jgi:predicted restriction endonuclease